MHKPRAAPRAKKLSWVKVTEHAGWEPRDSAGELVYNGKMWLLGGWFNSLGPFPNDVWSSADGVHWQRVVAAAPWVHADLPTTLVYDQKMWIMAGWFKGRLPGLGKQPGVVVKRWGQVELCHRQGPLAAALRSGRCGPRWQDVDPRRRGTILRRRSTPQRRLELRRRNPLGGGRGTCPLAVPGVSRRAQLRPQAVGLWRGQLRADLPCLQRRLELFRRRPLDEGHRPGAWHARIWFSSLVYKNRMWVLGGWSNQPSQNWNDVWSTADGVHWQPLPTETVWSKRHQQSAYVFADKLWIAGGNAWPCDGQVWQLQVPDSWFGARD